MAITDDQLATLREILDTYDDDWLLGHLTISSTGGRNFVVAVEKANCQDIKELFGSEYVYIEAAPARTQTG